MPAPRRIEIVEVGPRDGLQNEAAAVPTSVKLEFINRALEAGIRRIEVASFVNPRRVPQMADAEAILAALPRRDDVSYVGLVLNRAGFDRAAAAGCREIGMVVFTTDEFNRRNQGVTLRGVDPHLARDRRRRAGRRDPGAGHDFGGVRLPVRGRGAGRARRGDRARRGGRRPVRDRDRRHHRRRRARRR